MGIDAVISFRDTKVISLEELDSYLLKWFGQPDYSGDKYSWFEIRSGRYELNTLDRYYGPGYERGSWPILRGFLVWLQPRVEDLRYGSDTVDSNEHQSFESQLEELDSHFINVGYPYRWRV